jgi:hypothetical protein
MRRDRGAGDRKCKWRLWRNGQISAHEAPWPIGNKVCLPGHSLEAWLGTKKYGLDSISGSNLRSAGEEETLNTTIRSVWR